MEPLLKKPERQSYTLFPIARRDLWEMYLKARGVFWVPEEVNLEDDVIQWEGTLSDGDRRFLSYVLGFFACGDGIVSLNLAEEFMRKVACVEAFCFYSFQNAMENIHAEMYSILIDRLVDEDEKTRLFNAIETLPAVGDKARWALKWIGSGEFAEQLVAFAVVEGVFFASSFAAVFWFRSRGLMPGLVFSNELISRDEALHCQFACLLYRDHLAERLPECRVAEIVREAVEIEKRFCSDALPDDLVGMSAQRMGAYVEFVADELLKDLGCAATFGAENPFTFMDNTALETKTNFFERKVGNYRKSALHNTSFATTADF